MDASHLFPDLDAQVVAALERATGLRTADEEDWGSEEYDTVIAYLRRNALLPPAFIPKPQREWFSCCKPGRA